ncbi:MAG: protein phosphatase 2C domain-containing protein [Chloroflexi bacterium]|nr:protein phosphatase 2C domain-containing protein [Chloroflexota bacterium]MBV9597385.1 protein phosphatase 2C domain-containing protein [Chloroflexota bacterium]
MRGPAVFRLPKDGSTRAEYEDAIAWSRRHQRFAVADGASASAFARLWARLLVRAYVSGTLSAETLESDLGAAQHRWSADVERRDLPWYAAEQVRRGAFAALVGLTLDDSGTWSALAVGDACLFLVRDGRILTAVPLSDAQAFDNRPLLIGSRAEANTRLRDEGAIIAVAGTWQPGDTFLLMSDALAASFLELQLQPARSTCSALTVLEFQPTARGFRRWVRAMRSRRLLRNDDVSLVWLELPIDAAA